MKLKGQKWLLIMGFVEILMGVGTIALMLWILKQDPGKYAIYGTDAAHLATDAMWALVLIYSAAGLQILAGLLGMIFSGSKKAAGSLEVMGLILIVVQVFHYTHGGGSLDVISIIVNTVLLVAPVYYYYGAALNKKVADETKTTVEK